MYESRRRDNRNVIGTKVRYVRVSKIGRYENPYIVKGNIKHTGLKEAPKSRKDG